MHLNREMRIRLAVFTAIALLAMGLMSFQILKLPAKFFGIGRYDVTVQLPESGGLYATGNVTYRGVQAGRIKSVSLTDSGVEAVLSINRGFQIPSDVRAEVHSTSAIGEQYVDLIPRNGNSRPLRNGDVIRRPDTSIPPNINILLDSVNTGLKAIPQESLKTAVNEAFTAVGGLGPQLAEIVKGSSTLAIDARKNLDPLINLIDNSKPVLDSQVRSSAAIQAWASHLATVTGDLQKNDAALGKFIDEEGMIVTADKARVLIERLKPTLPVLMANLSSVGKVAIDYRDGIEQLLVMFPQVTAEGQGTFIADKDTNQPYKGEYLSFNLNVNLPPVCATGFLPPQQARVPTLVDYPERAQGDLYCRTPQDSPFNVRGAKNIPCATVPGKRAPTVKLCESNEQYVPLNDGYNWKGDPNATLSGQELPDIPPGVAAMPTAPPPPAAIAVSEYDPATGTYVAPNGKVYTQAELSQSARQDKTWQSMLSPPGY